MSIVRDKLLPKLRCRCKPWSPLSNCVIHHRRHMSSKYAESYLSPRRKELKEVKEVEDGPSSGTSTEHLERSQYQPGDQVTRTYQRTWTEFVPMKQKPRKLQKIYPSPARRSFYRGDMAPTTACPQDGGEQLRKVFPTAKQRNFQELAPSKKQRSVQPPKPVSCKIKIASYWSGRKNPSCVIKKAPRCIVKRKAMMPSFSECKAEDPKLPSVREGINNVGLCDMWTNWQRRR